ncbi:MAG: hypothetical protein H5T74_06215 [Actinobacteria bacterium]|nr:hypothetical protein [Actinomycetota bacterium]MDI6832001.1 hypothetical protein [Actinomycetota bacterium]
MQDGNACPACGLPRWLSRKLVWTTDGGIYFRSRRSERLVFLAEEEISVLVAEGVRLRGDQLLDTLRERRREFTRAEVASQMTPLRRAFLRRRPFAGKFVRLALEEASLLGCGNLEVVRLKPGKELELKARHPYHPQLLAGDIWGFWEGIYGVEALLSLNASTQYDWNITVKTVARGKHEPRREAPPRRPQRDYDLEVCEKCRLPLFTWELRWDEELGTIYQAGTHRHMVITSARGWQAVLEEIVGSRDGDLPPAVGGALAAAAAAEYGALKAENYKTAYRNFFMGLPFLGWGKPRRVTRKPFLIEAEIDGVPFPQLLAWKMAGFFEALEREPADIKHQREGETGRRYLIGPRLEGRFLEIRRMLPEEGRFVLPF